MQGIYFCAKDEMEIRARTIENSPRKCLSLTLSLKTMKTLLTAFIALVSFSSSLFAGTVPEAVKQAFAAKYPEASAVKWEQVEGTTFYGAEFKAGKLEVEVVFDEEGNLRSTETEVEYTDLPATVQSAFKSKFPGQAALEAAVFQRADGFTYYLIEIVKEGQTQELNFMENGEFAN